MQCYSTTPDFRGGEIDMFGGNQQGVWGAIGGPHRGVGVALSETNFGEFKRNFEAIK